MKYFACMQIFHRHEPRSILCLAGASAISQSASRTRRGWHDRGGWPGLGARVELGDWCGSRVPGLKIINHEACASQTMKRVVAAIEIEKLSGQTVELEASLSTQAVARSQVSRVEGESRQSVEELLFESRESEEPLFAFIYF